MARKQLVQEVNHIDIGEKTYLYRYYSNYCTAIVHLSPTYTDVIAWHHVPYLLFYGYLLFTSRPGTKMV
jgi:hypothetical protein